MEDIFGVAKPSNIYLGKLGCLKFMIYIYIFFFGGGMNSRCWARAYV